MVNQGKDRTAGAGLGRVWGVGGEGWEGGGSGSQHGHSNIICTGMKI